jgi:hypothetical protein
MALAVLDHEGDLFAYIEPGPADRALARGEIVRHPDNDRLFVLRPDADRLLRSPGLTPEARRRRYVKVNGRR